MHVGRVVFAQSFDHIPPYEFQKRVARYGGHCKVRGFPCLDQFLCLAFAQLTIRESLRDIEACLRSVENKLYRMGLRGRISRSTLADASDAHDWGIYADCAHVRIHTARPMYANESLGFDPDTTVYALDSTTSTSVCRCFRGLASAPGRPPSRCTPRSMCAARSPRLLRLPTAICTTSISSTPWSRKGRRLATTLA
jgi:hypothetical protein